MDADPLIGKDVAGYRIESELGRGAMGVVYVALQRSPQRRVALKLIAPGFAHDETFRRRFLREATAAAAIEHPHILPVYAAGEEDDILYLAMRLADGRDLREILAGTAGLSAERATTVAEQIGGALDAAHARGLVHRDVKPGNILVTLPSGGAADDFCYLTDFGISTWTTSTGSTITATGRMIGTADYVAPEQIEGGRVDGRADVYSLGCVLYECLTGRPPFAGRVAVATLYGHLHEDAPAPSSIRPDLPPDTDAVVARALRKPPEERYGSCHELARDLRDVLSGSPASSSTTMPTQRTAALAPTPHRAEATRSRGRRRLGMTAAVAAVLVVAAGVAVVASTDRGSPGTQSETSDLIRSGVQVTASSTAPSSTDGAGNPVTYLPGNVIDGDVETAWRTPGDGLGDRITLLFDTPVDLARIGLIPGYAKTDPETGVDRFFQNRIITEVRYLIPGLAPTTQTFRPEPTPQFIHLNVTTSRVAIVITGTTEPDGLDYTAISEIYVYGTRP